MNNKRVSNNQELSQTTYASSADFFLFLNLKGLLDCITDNNLSIHDKVLGNDIISAIHTILLNKNKILQFVEGISKGEQEVIQERVDDISRKFQQNITINETTVQVSHNTLLLKYKNSNDVVDFSDILYLEADGNYTYINTSKKKYVIKKSLKKFSITLGRGFSQCHRNYFVNMSYIESFTCKFLTLSNKVKIPLSYSYKKKFMEAFLASLN